MESVDLQMDDIFGDEREVDDDDDFPSVGPLPDLPTHEDANEDNEDAENSEVLSKLKDLSKGAAKKVIRKPQPKLDGSRLTGERGIPVLPKVFENVKFKGRGHEAEDLRIVMRYLEHWTHRLFPKMPFDEVLERIERLGTKKEVQTCIKKMRLDMPLLNDDFIGSDKDDDEEDGAATNGKDEQDVVDADTEEIWDEIMKEEYERQKSQKHIEPQSPSHLTQQLLESSSGTPSSTPNRSTPKTCGLTPEQLERMERNKRLALEKKAARNRFASPGISSQSLSSQQMPPPQSPITPRFSPRKSSPQKSSTVTSSSVAANNSSQGIPSLNLTFSDQSISQTSHMPSVNVSTAHVDNQQSQTGNSNSLQYDGQSVGTDITYIQNCNGTNLPQSDNTVMHNGQNMSALLSGVEPGNLSSSVNSTSDEMSEVIPLMNNIEDKKENSSRDSDISEVIPYISKNNIPSSTSEDVSEVIPMIGKTNGVSPTKICTDN